MKQIKKQVLLVLCVVACLFSLTACGKTTDAGSGIDPMTEESLKQQTVTLLEQMVSIPADSEENCADHRPPHAYRSRGR